MKLFNLLVRSVMAGFRRGGVPNWPWISAAIALGLVQIGAIALATYIDGSWFLPGADRGLLEHYGALALLVTDPLLVISASYAYCRFRLAMSSLPLCEPGSSTARVRGILRPYIEFIHLKGRGRWVYLSLAMVGLLSWLNNLRQTRTPHYYFGHDVFDSTSFINGFIVYKIILFNSWVVIYPLIGFLLVSMSFATRLILQRLRARKLICPNVLHPDGCYGLSNLGALNICLLLPYLLAFAVIFGVVVTHETAYASLVVPLFALSILFIVVSYVTIKPILVEARTIKRATYKRLVATSFQPYAGVPNQAAFALERLCFGFASASPYSRGTKTLLFAMRAVPPVLTATKYLWP
jgi:hypothetical protein